SSLNDPAAEHGGDAEVVADFLWINVLALVAEYGVARLHFKLRQVGEAIDQRLGDAVAQVIGIGIAANVTERQDGYGINGLNGRRERVASCKHRECKQRGGTNGDEPKPSTRLGG